MQSMTGFGKGTASKDGREMAIELKSVNHRFLDINMRLPRALAFLEDSIRRVLQTRLSRGHVEVWITYNNTRQDARTVEADLGLLGAYLASFDRIREQYSLKDDVTITNVSRLPDVFQVREAEEDDQTLIALATECTEAACRAMIEMRETEGTRLREDLAARIQAIETEVDGIATRAPMVVVEYKTKLKKRITELMDGAALDEARLAQEVAYFADKCAIDEEIVRLRAHVAHLRETFDSPEPAGRKLDFLIQEMNRETNTIGSKAAEMDILNRVVAIKGEIEKLREQVQNIE